MNRSNTMVAWVAALALAAFANGASAQQAVSTWQQIKQRGELRIGVTPGEPWYFKDPASGQWSGIGYRMGQQIAKDLNVKLVPGWKDFHAAFRNAQTNTVGKAIRADLAKSWLETPML